MIFQKKIRKIKSRLPEKKIGFGHNICNQNRTFPYDNNIANKQINIIYKKNKTREKYNWIGPQYL